MTDPAIGLLVPAPNEIFEPDMRRLLPTDQPVIHTARVEDPTEGALDGAAHSLKPLSNAMARLPAGPTYGVIAHGSVSATSALGTAAVTDALQATRTVTDVVTPLDAFIGVCRHLGLTAPGLVSPHGADGAASVRDALERAGLSVPATACFKLPTPEHVARMPLDSIAEAAQILGARADCDCVILGSANLPTFSVIRPLEAVIGKPVLSSNLATVWAIRRAMGMGAPDRPSALLL